MDREIESYWFTFAERAAQLALHSFRREYPSWTEDETPLDELVRWLELNVETFHPVDYPDGTFGFMDPDEEENLIWLCRDMHETLRRFTLAHELGHAILHCQGTTRIQQLVQEIEQALQESQVPETERYQQTLLSIPTPTLSLPTRADPCQEQDMNLHLLDQDHLQETLGLGLTYDPRSQRELAANIFAAELLMPRERVRRLYLEEQVAPASLAARFGVSQAAMLNRLSGFLQDALLSKPLPQQAPKPAAQPVSTTKKRHDTYQQAAIEAPTPALIVAGPGSGKTSTLIGRIEYMVHTLQVPPAQILALTFSRKAAQEMEERLAQVLTRQLPKVSTFHAFCADLLRRYGELVGLRPGFTLLDEAEGYFLLRQLSHSMRLKHYVKLSAPTFYFPDMLKAISRAKDELITPEEYTRLAQAMFELAQGQDDTEVLERAEKALEIAQVYTLYEQALGRRGDCDFGGLLLLTVRLLREHPEVLAEQQQVYQFVLVDEFQDMNRASGVLLRVLAGEAGRVWVVGDANQAIYGFRGASPANISQFAQDFPGAVILPLSRNYRSRPDLVSLAEAFRCTYLDKGQEPGKNQPVRVAETGPYVTLAQASNEASEVAGIIADIQHKRRQGYNYKDMMVLCRTRSQAQKITRALLEADLPTHERAGTLEQEHVKDVLGMLLLLSNESGMGLLRVARLPDYRLSQEDIEALLLSAHERRVSPRGLLLTEEFPLDISSEGRNTLQRLVSSMRALQQCNDTWTCMSQYLLQETSLVRDLLRHPEDEVAKGLLLDYDRLLQLARHYDQQLEARRRVLAQEAVSLEELSMEARLKGFLEYLSMLVVLRQDGATRESGEGEDEEEANIIQVMTVHASKGLEFPVVYMPGLVQNRFPLTYRSSAVNAPDGMLLAKNTGRAAHDGGEACLFYVGATRARDHLVLSYSERYGKKSYKRSLFLDPLEAAMPQERLAQLAWEAHGEIEERVEESLKPISIQPGERFLDRMRPTDLSSSLVEVYRRCPRQYAYSTIYHFDGDADAYRLFRQATQQTVEVLHKQLASMADSSQGTLPTFEELEALYKRHWRELGGEDMPFAPMYEAHGIEVVEGMRQKLVTQSETQWSMRESLHVDLAGRSVRVTVDRIESSSQPQEEGPLRFVRTRYGKSKEKPKADTRELFYTLASRQHHPGRSVELHSHNMSTGETIPMKLTEKKEQSLYGELEQCIEGIERDEYPARPAEPSRCPTCPFFFICPA
ncbi:UvrD-helicase domain-containing protein [Ktedonobacter racemifer]|uniref:DNA 3'-5' helicase n=1 Tax=Ktedonobacter racemifer DSM 44963 TaxID=485913 RepID=D6TN69_KTERA|nr:UvrD-helicase domain-containing protein [Ktedonobacter racemifer]EFH87219.1 UvrD/REP helicase [Ktedonobacter racemifer DSM 44963]